MRSFPLARLDARAGRLYFGVQALAGIAWWLGVFLVPGVAKATLGELNPVIVACFDLPLFVAASGAVALGARRAVWIVVPWTVLVALGMAVYASVTTLAGWGALLMVAAAIASVAAGLLAWLGRLPLELIISGPLSFRPARATTSAGILAQTALQIVVVWGLSLGVVPAAIAFFEARWGLRLDWPAWVPTAGWAVFSCASPLGVWAAVSMSMVGRGTPLPSAMAHRLVIAGPYLWVRNPMAVAGVTQAVAVGLVMGSWLVVLYAFAGALAWNYAVRPQEEADLSTRFGAQFDDYRDRVSCWVPRRRYR